MSSRGSWAVLGAAALVALALPQCGTRFTTDDDEDAGAGGLDGVPEPRGGSSSGDGFGGEGTSGDAGAGDDGGTRTRGGQGGTNGMPVGGGGGVGAAGGTDGSSGSDGVGGASGEGGNGGTAGSAGSTIDGGAGAGGSFGGASGTGGTPMTGGGGGTGGTSSGGMAGTGGAAGTSGGSGTSGTAGGSGTAGAGGSGGAMDWMPCPNPRLPAQEGPTSGNSGNFGTTDAVCYRVDAEITLWRCSALGERTVHVNGVAVTCSTSDATWPLPPRVNGSWYFEFSAGEPAHTAFYWTI